MKFFSINTLIPTTLRFRNHTFLFAFVLLIQTFTYPLKAQRWEIGGGLGLTHYKGEIYPTFKPLAFNGGANALLRYNLSRSVSVKATGMVGFLSANDKRVNNILNQERGFSFRNNIWDAGMQIEYNFYNFRTNDIYEKDWTPYVFVGFNMGAVFNRDSLHYKVNFVHYEPGTTTEDVSYIDYTKVAKGNKNINQNVIPFGFGFKKKLRANLNLSAEFGCRKTFSDSNIDNIGYEDVLVSTNTIIKEAPRVGNSIVDINSSKYQYSNKYLMPNTRFKDMYYYTNVSISYVFGSVVCPNTTPLNSLRSVKRKHRRR